MGYLWIKSVSVAIFWFCGEIFCALDFESCEYFNVSLSILTNKFNTKVNEQKLFQTCILHCVNIYEKSTKFLH